MNKITTGILAAAVALTFASGATAARYEGFGDGLPLEAAAAQIVPDGWSVDYAEGVDRKSSVSWSSAPDWKAALSSAVAKKGYEASFGGSVVIIRKAEPKQRTAEAPRSAPKAEQPARRSTERRTEAPRPAPRRETRPATPAPAPKPEGGGGFKIAPYVPAQPKAAPAPTQGGGLAQPKDGFRPYAGASGAVTKDGPAGQPAPARTASFAVEAGETLRAALERWTKTAGWEVVWNSQFDYPIEASAAFKGDFVQAAQALLAAMSDARPKITADFWTGNRVLVVGNSAADEAN